MTKPLVVGGASLNRLLYVDSFGPLDGDHTGFPNRDFEGLGSTGIGKALALQGLGFDPVLQTVLGRDAAGKTVSETLARSGLEMHIDWVDRPTENHISLMGPNGLRHSYLLNVSQAGDVQDIEPLRPFWQAAPVVFLNITASSLAFLPLARQEDRPVWVDLHDWDGENPHHQQFADVADVIQVSLAAGLGDEAIKALRERCELVVLTDAAKGAWLLEGKTEHHQPALAAQVVDTNGAGDSFFVALWAARRAGLALAEAGQFAAKAAARTVSSQTICGELGDLRPTSF